MLGKILKSIKKNIKELNQNDEKLVNEISLDEENSLERKEQKKENVILRDENSYDDNKGQCKEKIQRNNKNLEKNAQEKNTQEKNIQELDLNDDEIKAYIKDIKIRRERSIKAINIYSGEEKIFNSHKECCKKLKLPLGYIKENLMYGYIDYLGNSINYLAKELKVKCNLDDEFWYLEEKKSPMEIYNNLNNKIFTSKLSQKAREEILSSESIHPITMNYKFECMDEEYDDYFKMYGAIIKRGGKKKIELLDKNNNIVERFKSVDECADFLNKDKDYIKKALKLGENKIGRYMIRYSLRRI